jgi:hypothetical protein
VEVTLLAGKGEQFFKKVQPAIGGDRFSEQVVNPLFFGSECEGALFMNSRHLGCPVPSG